MHSEDNVYNYVVESINKLLIHGIEFYNNKDKSLQNRLIDIYDYINNDDQVEIVIEKDKEKELPIDAVMPSNNQDEINKLTKNFMNKMTDIKISVLNLGMEEEKTIDSPKKTVEVTEKLEQTITPFTEAVKPTEKDSNSDKSVLANMLEKLKNEDFDDISFDDADEALKNVSDEELLLEDKDDLFGKTTFDIHFDFDDNKEKLDDLEKIDDNEEPIENKPSLLDIFKKKD